MCNYLSFCVSLDGEKTWFGNDLSSHSACAKQHGLKPETYREAEWAGDNESKLCVRVLSIDPHNEGWLRACILTKWPTRSDLENWIEKNVPSALVQNRVQVAGDASTQTAGESSTQTAGGNSWQCGGKNTVQAQWSCDYQTRYVRIVPPEHENKWCFAFNGTWRLATAEEEAMLNTKVK